MPVYYKKGYKYQLVADYTCSVNIHPEQDIVTKYISLTIGGRLTLRDGYAWDGISGPTFDTEDTRRGSLVHDALYQLMRLGLLPQSARPAADVEFRTICISAGMWEMRAWVDLKGLKLFGASAAHPRNKKKVFVAP